MSEGHINLVWHCLTLAEEPLRFLLRHVNGRLGHYRRPERRLAAALPLPRWQSRR